MTAETRPEILLVSLDGELPSWLRERKALRDHDWSAYLKPVPRGILVLSLPHGQESSGVVLVDVGQTQARATHGGSRHLPSWFEKHFLWRDVEGTREQRFPFVLLYDIEGDQNLPYELKRQGAHSFEYLSRNCQRWKSPNDLSIAVNYVWSQWQDPEWESRYKHEALEASTRIVIPVLRSDEVFDHKCWNTVLNNIGTLFKEKGYDFNNILCGRFGASAGKTEASDAILHARTVIVMISNELLDSYLWHDTIWPKLRKRLKPDVAPVIIHWFVTTPTLWDKIPMELSEITPIHPSLKDVQKVKSTQGGTLCSIRSASHFAHDILDISRALYAKYKITEAECPPEG